MEIRKRLERLEKVVGGREDPDYPHLIGLNDDGTYDVGGQAMTEQEFRAWEEKGTRLRKFKGPVIVIDI